jgi:hypothetical protein
MRSPDPTSGRATSEVDVDYTALRRLADALRGLAQEMSSRDGSLQADLVDPELHDALRHVERDWWDQRQRLRSYFEGAATAVEGALAAYQGTDLQVCRAMAPAPPVRPVPAVRRVGR